MVSVQPNYKLSNHRRFVHKTLRVSDEVKMKMDSSRPFPIYGRVGLKHHNLERYASRSI